MQTSLSDAGIFRVDILQAITQVQAAQKDLSDRLFVLESLLESSMEA
ncbi:MAG: hypothetical protein ABFC21_09750 [Rectinema sp.]